MAFTCLGIALDRAISNVPKFSQQNTTAAFAIQLGVRIGGMCADLALGIALGIIASLGIHGVFCLPMAVSYTFVALGASSVIGMAVITSIMACLSGPKHQQWLPES